MIIHQLFGFFYALFYLTLTKYRKDSYQKISLTKNRIKYKKMVSN